MSEDRKLQNVIDEILSLQSIYKNKVKDIKHTRFLYTKLLHEKNSNPMTGLTGLRGSGKTVLFLQLLDALDNAIYISLDDFQIRPFNLFKLAQMLQEDYNIKYLLLDEIHNIPNWSVYLKQIYDILDLKVYFTSSVSLDILNTKVDLARRVIIRTLPVLSYREYLLLAHNQEHKTKSLAEILDTNQYTADHLLEAEFKNYLESPLPSLLNMTRPNRINVIRNILHTAIERDLAAAFPLTYNELLQIKQMLNFLMLLPSPDISLSQLAKNLLITKYKAQKYVNLLQKLFIVHIVYPKGTNVLQEPKILLNIPFRAYDDATDYLRFSDSAIDHSELLAGTIKEDFFVSMLKAVNQPVYYLKTRRGKKTPDYLIELREKGRVKRYVVEIGGRKKGFSQFKGIKPGFVKRIAVYPFVRKRGSIPLYEFGFLY